LGESGEGEGWMKELERKRSKMEGGERSGEGREEEGE